MQKRIAGSILITLAILMALMPLAKATTQHYWWDNVYFFEDDTPYPHPDIEYYDISRYSDWSIEGTRLYHHQANFVKSGLIVEGSIGLLTILGAWIGVKVGGGTTGAVVGGFVGLTLGLIISVVGDTLLLDERGCIWWWVSTFFVDWVIAYQDILYYYINTNPVMATILITIAFNGCGYFRAGLITLFDPLGIGAPAPYDGGCPILSVYDGTDYACEGLLDIHNPEGIDVVYQHTLVSTPQRENGTYLMRLTEHNQTESHIDQVKLYAILEDETNIKLPLIHAWHSEDGNVLPQLLLSDEWKTDTLGADLNNGTSESIDLKFASLSPNLEITGFVFEIEGNNRIVKQP